MCDLGAQTCLGCHPTKDTWKKHAHANGIHEPGNSAPLQTQARLDLVDASLLAKFAANTTLYFYAYDGTRGDDKYIRDHSFIIPRRDNPARQAVFTKGRRSHLGGSR